jgi:hypothetical protein
VAVVVVVGGPAVVGGGVEPPVRRAVVVVVGAAVEPGGAVAAGNAPRDSLTAEELKLNSPARPMTVPVIMIGAGFMLSFRDFGPCRFS